MLPELIQHADLDESRLSKASHVLVLVHTGNKCRSGDVPLATLLARLLARKHAKVGDLAKEPVAGNTDSGALIVWVMIDAASPVFDQQVQVRKAVRLLLDDSPKELTIAVCGDQTERRRAAGLGIYAALVNGVPLPTRKTEPVARTLKKIILLGHLGSGDLLDRHACAEGNLLCRQLTVLPPNELTPRAYRKRIAALARQYGWKRQEHDLESLRKMGAGAFVAVAQGSAEQDAAIVHLRYTNKQAAQTIALVGKGICFDTGGHNLKPARGMLGMHEDMNGSAVALGILLAATRLKLPINIDCWLAIAENHLSPLAYKQNDIVTALNGTTIEIVHTDAEGRMVLADALTLAARQKPSLIIDFATLTGSMIYALGNRYSGVFSNDEKLLAQAMLAGRASGERVNPFPFDADYDAALKSEVADTKQCLLAGEADHILAARFLSRFVEGLPWIHMDLAAANCEGGLGAVATQTTGFGVAWGLQLITRMAESKGKWL